MTTQATPDYNADMQRQVTATLAAQALARDWQAKADEQRKEIEALKAERDDLKAHFDVARRRGDKYLGEIGEARLLLKGYPDGGLLDAIRALMQELAALRSTAGEDGT